MEIEYFVTYGCSTGTLGVQYYFLPLYGPDVLIPFEPDTQAYPPFAAGRPAEEK
jgi:hypothetical protein